LAALAAAVVLIAVATAWHIATPPAAVIAPANGLEGMAWVPGGKFLMGSDHKLAQDNERPAHRVRVVRGPKGNTLALKVADDVKLEELSAGDRISVTHTEALAVEMVAQPAKQAPAKKAPEKKPG